uniref:RNA helicase n=1 Tax=Glossina brevipalpis TaxID=37001 RepID=A0A1A9WNX6_9MUSC
MDECNDGPRQYNGGGSGGGGGGGGGGGVARNRNQFHNDRNNHQQMEENNDGQHQYNGGGGSGGGGGGGRNRYQLQNDSNNHQQIDESNDGGPRHHHNNDGGGTRNRNQFRNQGYRQYGREEPSESSFHYDNNKETSRVENDFYTETNQEMPSDKDGCIDWTALNAKADIERAEKWAKCPQLTKNFYKEDPEVTNLDENEIAQIRLDNNNITVKRVFVQENDQPDNIPNPIWKFEHCFAPYPDLLDELAKQGFKTPSPIQTQAWPILLKGEDMIGIAQTGTGKTLAFLLPALVHIEYQSTPRSERGGPNVLILAPTRELALQIEKEVNKYSFRGIKAVCVYGGGNRNDQIRHVEQGVEVIICTPGRLNDLVQANVIDVTTITYLVLDEADRMLDMGFEPQIRKVLLDIRPDRQTIMTSATWPPGVQHDITTFPKIILTFCTNEGYGPMFLEFDKFLYRKKGTT